MIRRWEDSSEPLSLPNDDNCLSSAPLASCKYTPSSDSTWKSEKTVCASEGEADIVLV